MARQVLENGVILPAEYSDDWYDDMTSNLTKLDDVIGSDSEKLSSADVGAAALSNSYNDLDNLPTIPTVNDATLTIQKNGVDVQTFTANASSNVTANIPVPTKTSDLTNDSNFVDTSNSAVASGITSAKVTSYDSHVADTDIHVTTADKTKWNNNVTQSYVFRYSGTAVVPNSTIAYSTIDNTDNIKSGDKILDVDGKLFEITAVDTTNQTVTVSSALIDIALDANVVHTNRNDDVSIPLNSTSAELGVTGGSTDITFLDKNGKKLSGLMLGNYESSKLSYVRLNIFDKDTNNNEIQDTLEYAYVSNNANAYLRVYRDNFCTLGSSSYRWKGVYATNYYYGANNVEFSTKFVTTDTNQTIAGQKVFNDINAISSSAEIGVSGGNNSFKVLDKNKKTISRLEGGTLSSGMAYCYLLVNNGSDVFNGVNLYQSSANSAQLRPYSSTLSLQLGASNRYFSDCYTSKINGLTPSSLGMPVAPSSTSYVDISSYITVLDSSSANTYTPPSNGYITFSVTGNLVQIFHDYGLQGKWTVQAGNANRGFIPVLGGVEVKIYLIASSVDKFWFIPCQGNV